MHPVKKYRHNTGSVFNSVSIITTSLAVSTHMGQYFTVRFAKQFHTFNFLNPNIYIYIRKTIFDQFLYIPRSSNFELEF